MASLLDIAQMTGPTKSWQMAGIQNAEAQAGAEHMKQSGRLTRNFTQYDLPDLTNRFAARGTFHSGSTATQAQRLQTAFDEAQQDLGDQLHYTLLDLGQKKVAVNTGGTF